MWRIGGSAWSVERERGSARALDSSALVSAFAPWQGLRYATRLKMVSMNPWVRRAAALVTAPLPPVQRPARGAGSADRNPAGDRTMRLDDQVFERVVALKRPPLFRFLPFETLMEVARSVQARVCLAGENGEHGRHRRAGSPQLGGGRAD
jgi:hypothetical protein